MKKEGKWFKNHGCVSASFESEGFLRKKLREAVKTLANLSPFLRTEPVSGRPVSGLPVKFLELNRRSDRLVCIRRIETPFSSIEKSKPR